MNLYRFSPIRTKEQFMEALKHIHRSSYELCQNSFGHFFPNAGNIAIFCHYDEEFEYLTGLRSELTEPSENPDKKYFKLLEPITVRAARDFPETTYTYLYIRQPDPYRHHVGDIDFYVESTQYQELKKSLQEGTKIPGARIFPRVDLDMIELYNPDIDVLAYVSEQTMTEKVHIRIKN